MLSVMPAPLLKLVLSWRPHASVFIEVVLVVMPAFRATVGSLPALAILMLRSLWAMAF